jgi:hypothetical protein
MSRFVRPETRTLTLANGDHLIVRARLTAGEQREQFARMYTQGPMGQVHRNLLMIDVGLVIAYLLDWNLKDDAGQLVPIRALSAADLHQVLNQLDPVDFEEIQKAIEAHEKAMVAERDDQKKILTGGPA